MRHKKFGKKNRMEKRLLVQVVQVLVLVQVRNRKPKVCMRLKNEDVATKNADQPTSDDITET
jgi:hypothetical protein